MSLSPGTHFGSYEILARIGAGGMGDVYRARDSRLKRDVAVKVVSRAWAHDKDRVARLQREAELLASLNNPNIAAIYGIEEAGGVQALILELVEGPTLAEPLTSGPIALADVLSIAGQIANALDSAHERGIVHRDLKPANIKVREDGTVKVLDFGLAKALVPDIADLDPSESPTLKSTGMTRMGVILGTAGYMSPEQARGQAIDKRADIWAFGCVLYEMLTGRCPFIKGTVTETLAAILEREPDWSVLPASTPPGLVSLLRRCLAKDRSQRLRDIGDARHQLDELETVAVSGGAIAPQSSRPSRVLAAAVILLSLITVSVVFWSRRTGPRDAQVVHSLGPRFSRITSDASFSTEPALSRDGALVVYASDRAGDGQLDLWLQRTAGGQPIRLTEDPADDRQPDFSPDGSLIAFRSDRGGGGIYVLPALGGDARLVAEGGRGPRFSPDGRRIAYWTGPWLSGNGPRASGFEIFVVPATGGQPIRIADGFTTATNPVWSPDGRSLMFFGRKTADSALSGLFDWWWISLDGGEPVPTGAYSLFADKGLVGNIESGGNATDSLPAVWTPSGVLFSAGFGESINLWRLDVSQHSGKVIDTSLVRLTNAAGRELLPSADGMGRIALQMATEGEVSLTLPLSPNVGKATGPIVRHSFEAGGLAGRNSLDSAGKLLAYSKHRANEFEIWVKDLTTDQERHLVTTTTGSAPNPVISHDGTKVAYVVTEGGEPRGYIVSTAGGKPKKVCDGCALQGWFADNRRILSIDRSGEGVEGRVHILDVVSETKQILLVDPKGGIARLDVSEDSRWISFSSRRSVWITSVRPGDPPPENEWISILTIAAGTAERACGWSPDGRLLYLLLERDGFRDLYAQHIDPTRGVPLGDPFVVRHLHDPRRRWGSTPFGTAIVSNAFVFNQSETTGSIWLLDPRSQP